MPSTYKVLGQANPSATTLTDCYTVPGATSAVVSSILVANRSSTPTSFRLSVAPAGAADSDEQYIAYDADLEGNEVWCYTAGLTLTATDVVRVYAADATVSFNIFGEELS